MSHPIPLKTLQLKVMMSGGLKEGILYLSVVPESTVSIKIETALSSAEK
jgi:hypothetical protein